MLRRLRGVGRRRRWVLASLGAALLLCSATSIVLGMLRPAMTRLTELHACPACYGRSACGDAMVLSARAASFDPFGAKNVYLGEDGERRVVLKKLAHDSELRAFDRALCEDSRLAALCRDGGAAPGDIDFRERVVEEMRKGLAAESGASLRLCPAIDRVDDLFGNVYANFGEAEEFSRAYIWTLIKINPEPLILQILPAAEGWPVPKYLGACGRVVLEEYVGLPLIAYRRATWFRRAKIASSLLEAARMFTFRDEDFGFYLTDVSPDNIAVDSDGRAKFVDLENVVVVDKRASGNLPKEWDELEANDVNSSCEDCLTFSPADICGHRLSDHNYYAVCQHLLAPRTSSSLIPGGLLDDVPANVLRRYPVLPDLIERCAFPKPPGTRITYGDELRELLDAIVEQNG